MTRASRRSPFGNRWSGSFVRKPDEMADRVWLRFTQRARNPFCQSDHGGKLALDMIGYLSDGPSRHGNPLRRPQWRECSRLARSSPGHALVVAETERDRIRERVTQAKRDQRQRNRYLGGIVPFGYRVGEDGGLVPDPQEQEIIASARALRAEGATLRAIQHTLGTPYGRKLSLDALQRVLSDMAAK